MPPPGYERLLLGHAVAVARSDVAVSIRRCLVNADGTRSTLHEYAARQPDATPLHGRGAAYAVSLPPPQAQLRAVVRHNRHGGAFAALTGDRFLSPTRAPYELEVSLRLAQAGVPTPDVLAYALYPPGGLLQRSDVCSRAIAGGRDLADFLDGSADERAAAFGATATLLAILARAGARHHDLNAKNVLVTPEQAYVLDVDRITFGLRPDAALEGNVARLARSLRKWRDRYGAKVTEQEITALESDARRAGVAA